MPVDLYDDRIIRISPEPDVPVVVGPWKALEQGDVIAFKPHGSWILGRVLYFQRQCSEIVRCILAEPSGVVSLQGLAPWCEWVLVEKCVVPENVR